MSGPLTALGQDPGFHVDQNVMIPMRDGTLLTANIYKPQAEGSHPVILLEAEGEDEGGDVDETSDGGTREVTLKTGSYFFSEGVDWHEGLNVGDTTVSYLMIEPKSP